MGELEKPSRVEIGSRWKNGDGDERIVSEEACYFGDAREGTGRAFWFTHGTWANEREMLAPGGDYAYLGPAVPSPAVTPTPWAVGQRRRGKIYGNKDMTGGVYFEGEYTVVPRNRRVCSFDCLVETPTGRLLGVMEFWPSELLSSPPLETRVMEAPAHWCLGSRWQQWDIEDATYRVVRISGDAKATLVWEEGGDAEQRGSFKFDAERWTFRGWHPRSTPTAPRDCLHELPASECQICSKPAGAGGTTAVVVPQKREVSTNGRDWLPYDGYLADADGFDRYKHRRVDGVVVKVLGTTACGLCEEIAQLGYDGHCVTCSADDDRQYAGRMASRPRPAAPSVPITAISPLSKPPVSSRAYWPHTKE